MRTTKLYYRKGRGRGTRGMSNNDLKCPKCDKQHHPAESCNFVHTDMPETTINAVCTECFKKDVEIEQLKYQIEKIIDHVQEVDTQKDVEIAALKREIERVVEIFRIYRKVIKYLEVKE